MTEYSLLPHPDFPNAAVKAIVVTVDRSIDWLHLDYRIDGDADAIRWPAKVDPAFADGLWQHTCFEAFCRIDGREAYREVNLSPSGEWAVYDFVGYRKGMSRAPRQPIRNFRAKERRIEAVVDIGRGDWDVGVSAVIEAADGSKSYWALKHADGPPDFHNRDCFAARLPAPARA